MKRKTAEKGEGGKIGKRLVDGRWRRREHRGISNDRTDHPRETAPLLVVTLNPYKRHVIS